jgi:hypothetical protein
MPDFDSSPLTLGTYCGTKQHEPPYWAVQPQYTVARQESGNDAHVYPTPAELYCQTPQHLLHCYKAEAELPYMIFFLIKLNWLDNEDL